METMSYAATYIVHSDRVRRPVSHGGIGTHWVADTQSQDTE